MLNSRCWRVWTEVTLVLLALALMCPRYAEATSALLPQRHAVAVVSRGAVWFDEGTVWLSGFGLGERVLGGLTGKERLWKMAASDSSAAVLDRGRGFLAGVLPASLEPVPHPRPISGGGCKRWEPAIGSLSDFAVAGEELVDSGECQEGPDVVGEQEAAIRQPLFVRSLRGGRWRVMRWLAGHYPPILTAEGDRVAVGVQVSLARMKVSIVDVLTKRTTARFSLPDGYLSFASPTRLVLSVPTEFWPEEARFPLGPQIEGRHSYPSARAYRLVLYSARGQRLAGLGSAPEVPLVSGMHLVAETYADGEDTVSVRGVTGSEEQTAVVGFNPPGRALVALGFRWPALAVVETTSAVLSPSQVNCQTGYYSAASAPFLAFFDLARHEPFSAPPASSLLESSHLLENCPPRLWA